jgi:hypothetical protein
MSDLAAEL